MRGSVASVLVLFAVALGCSSGSANTATDVGGAETSPTDDSAGEVSLLDSSSTSDSAPAADSAAVDSDRVDSDPVDSDPVADSGVSVDSGPPSDSALVGLPGIRAWDALPAGEKAKVTAFRSFFLHQSVGGDLEDGAEFNGYKFDYVTSSSTKLAPGLSGGLFSSSNGDPEGKIAEFRKLALANKATLRVAIMKFGYADIVSDKVLTAQRVYQAAVADIKAAGIRVLHVTPPFVYSVPAENAPKMATRTWMRSTFPTDVIFDLEDIESTDPTTGARCERGGSWEICNAVRSTTGCPSLNQGIDAPSGQGHICHKPHGQQFAKAFLYAIYLAGK